MGRQTDTDRQTEFASSAEDAAHAQRPWAWGKDGFCYHLQMFDAHEFPPQKMLVCAAPIKCERLANTRPCSARAPWGWTGWNLLPGAQLIFHRMAKPACCTTAVRLSFVRQYFEQLFWSCWRGMRVLSLEMGRILFHLHSKAGLWRIRSNYKPQGPNL